MTSNDSIKVRFENRKEQTIWIISRIEYQIHHPFFSDTID